ncbi:hypothetical protein BBJ28_00025971, partial [Nothophytophthora sp. Chile5]
MLAPTPSVPVSSAPDVAGSAVAVPSVVGSAAFVLEAAASTAAAVTAITLAATDGATTITTTADIAATSAAAATETTSMSAAAAETTTVSDAAAVSVHTAAPSVSHNQSALALAGASERRGLRDRASRSRSEPSRRPYVVPPFKVSSHGRARLIVAPRLVGVPATMQDLASESLLQDGEVGLERMVELRDLPPHAIRELSKIVGEDAGESWLRPLSTPRSTEAASLVAGTARFQREAIPLLQHYAEEGFARRVLAAPRHMNMVLRQFQELERVRLLHVAPSAVQLAELRADRDRLLQELGTQQAYWDSRLALADDVRRRQFKATMVEAETAHAVASSSKDVTIVALKRERDGLQAELKAAQDRESILRTRMANARLANPESLLDFLDTHTVFNTNWERLQGVLQHYCDGTASPTAWRTRVDVVALELYHYQQRPYQNAASRAASAPTAAAAARDPSDSEEKESSGGSIPPTASAPGARSGTSVARNLSSTSFAVSGFSDSEGAAAAAHTVDLTSSAPMAGSAGASSAPTPPVAVQHYPSSHIGGTRGTRPSRELHSVSLSKAKELLPAG